MSLAPRKPKAPVFTMFCATGSKNHGICSVFETSPSKNIGTYSMLHAKIWKHCNLRGFSSRAQQTLTKHGPNTLQNWPSEACIFCSSHGPSKNLNPHQHEVGEGSAAGARPRVAKASCWLHHRTASPDSRAAAATPRKEMPKRRRVSNATVPGGGTLVCQSIGEIYGQPGGATIDLTGYVIQLG